MRMANLRQRALEAAAADAKAGRGGMVNGRRVQPDVVNGIAYDADDGRLFVSGKLWPRIYQIEVQEVAAEAAAALRKARAECIVKGGRVAG